MDIKLQIIHFRGRSKFLLYTHWWSDSLFDGLIAFFAEILTKENWAVIDNFLSGTIFNQINQEQENSISDPLLYY